MDALTQLSTDHRSTPMVPRVTPSVMVGAAQPMARLSALEWSIVAMAENDGLSSIREPGRLVSALAALFGISQPNRLANDRLESLRRISIFAWTKGWDVPQAEVAGFVAAGFTTDQFQLILQSVCEARQKSRRVNAR